MDEIIAIYKPVGPTSHDMVNRVRRITGSRRVGHAGTLDPLACGILIVGIGTATKRLGELSQADKEYAATVKLGETSTTDDAEGEKTAVQVKQRPTDQEIAKVLHRFEGQIDQTPPIYSAVKVKGKEAYKYARAGKKVTLKPRAVFIKTITLNTYRWPQLTLTIACGSGVYIRSLARDIGRDLGSGAYLTALERVRVGTYTIADTLTLEQLEQRFKQVK